MLLALYMLFFSGFMSCALVRNAYSGTNCSKVLSPFYTASHKHCLRPPLVLHLARGRMNQLPSHSSVCASSGLGSLMGNGDVCLGMHPLCLLGAGSRGMGVKISFELTQVNGKIGKGMKALVVNDLYV